MIIDEIYSVSRGAPWVEFELRLQALTPNEERVHRRKRERVKQRVERVRAAHGERGADWSWQTAAIGERREQRARALRGTQRAVERHVRREARPSRREHQRRAEQLAERTEHEAART